ncbi:MAG: hypothetical protein AAF311_08515 [Pseudomonadota bacterium]
MRRLSTFLGSGAALLATPALAHVGDHGEHGVAHFLADHGFAAGLAALAIIAVGAILLMNRKG